MPAFRRNSQPECATPKQDYCNSCKIIVTFPASEASDAPQKAIGADMRNEHGFFMNE